MQRCHNHGDEYSFFERCVPLFEGLWALGESSTWLMGMWIHRWVMCMENFSRQRGRSRRHLEIWKGTTDKWWLLLTRRWKTGLILHYSNPTILSDSVVVEKFMQCAETFNHGGDGKEYRAVNEDQEKFQKRHGSFSRRKGDVNALSSIRVSCCNHFCPNFFAINFAHVWYISLDFVASWWRLQGGGKLDLQRMAIRNLSLTSSSSGCERNWCTFEEVSF